MDLAGVLFAFIDGLGGPEMVVIFIVVLMLFGGQKLPEFARGLGKTIREFKKAAAGVEEEFKRALDDDERKKNAAALAALPAATSPNINPGAESPPAETQDYQDGYYGDSYGDGSGSDPANPDATASDSSAADTAGTPADDSPERKVDAAESGDAAPSNSEPGVAGAEPHAPDDDIPASAETPSADDDAGPGTKKQPAEPPPAATNPPAGP